MGEALSSADQHRRIMVELHTRLQPAYLKLYARDLFWDELQKIRQCDNEDDYTDDEWLGALNALDVFLQRNSILCSRLGLKPGMGPRGIEDRFSVEGKPRRDYMGLVEKFRWYDYDVFLRVMRELVPQVLPIDNICERKFLEGLRRTSEFLRQPRFSRLREYAVLFAYKGPQCFLHRRDRARVFLRLLSDKYEPKPTVSYVKRLKYGLD